jgi:hypothetical protein
MSTQLILYPQSYKGIYSFNSENEFIVDGIHFTTIDASTSYSTTGSIDAHLTATPPTIVNTWFRFRNTGSSTPAFPVETSGNLVIDGTTPSSYSGVYQKMSNLTIGASYTLTVNMTAIAAAGHLVDIKIWNLTLNSPVGGSLVGANASQLTVTFIAETTNDVVAINYYSTSSANLTISSISLIPTGISPSEIYTDLIDGQVICDLYEEEDIPLTLSIDNFKSVAEKVQSYSKDFDLPATKRNNRIFNNMFDVTRADDGIIFNPYVKTRSVLKQNGFILFEGYLRLINIKDKNGEISYNVNLYSEVIALADVLKDSTFSDLDFTELTHLYNKNTIKDSWEDVGAGNGVPLTYPLSTSSFAYDSVTGTGHTQVLKYPFIDWEHQYLVGGTPGGNASANNGCPELTALEQAFRPCIKLKYLIDKIFAATNQFTYTSSFFDSADFGNLFMDFNWGSNEFGTEVTVGLYGNSSASPNVLSTTSFAALPLDQTTFDTAMGWDSANSRFVATYDNQPFLMTVPAFSPVFYSTQTLETRWAHYNSSNVLINTYQVTSQVMPVGIVTPPLETPLTYMILDAGDYIQYEWKTNTAGEAKVGNNQFLIIVGTTGDLIVTSNTMLQTLRGELGQWDFLKGIITMFNLVTMVDEDNPNNILIEPYGDIFINNTRSNDVSDLSLSSRFDGKVHDWTEKLDASEMELKPLTELNKNTIFQFVEDEDDYIFRQFKTAQSGHLYGSKKIDASGFTVLQGTKEIVADPFAATVSKPLMTQFPNFITPAIYAMTDDGTAEGFDNSPRIFYNNGEKSTGTTYYIPPQNDKPGENQGQFLQFSHLSAIPTVVTTPPAVTDTRDFVFESTQLLSGLGSPPTNNLYSTYWQPYFNELYNADTRTMTLKVNLSPSDIAAFKFYDVVMIKNRTFRVNKIEYKPNTLAKVEFILIP